MSNFQSSGYIDQTLWLTITTASLQVYNNIFFDIFHWYTVNFIYVSRKNKETKWDEMNIIATLHPPDKDYGHMKIEEPKTPFNYEMPENLDVLDAVELAERIRLGADKLPKAMEDSDESEEEVEELTPEEIEKRQDFENKRKKHYNEFYAVKLARKLLEEEEDDEDDEKRGGGGNASRIDEDNDDNEVEMAKCL